MKRKLFLFGAIMVVLTIFAVSFLNRGGDVLDVVRVPAESTRYTEEEIEAAMDIAIEAFSNGFEGCKLLNIGYDEAETLAEIARQRDRHGELRLLVLVSEFYAGDKAEACFNPNMTYTGWKWILRDDGDGWKMVTWGYA